MNNKDNLNIQENSSPGVEMNNTVQSASISDSFISEPKTINEDFGDMGFDAALPKESAKTASETTNVDEDFGDMDYSTVSNEVIKKPEKELPVAIDNTNTDLGDLNIGYDEESFRSSELAANISPVVDEKITKTINQTVALNNHKMRASMTEALDEYNSDRLNELKKDRKKRQRKRHFFGVVKFLFVFIIIALLMTNAQIRVRALIIFQDTKQLLIDIFNDDQTTSNHIADDFLDTLGTHLNEVNTYEIEEPEEEEE